MLVPIFIIAFVAAVHKVATGVPQPNQTQLVSTVNKGIGTPQKGGNYAPGVPVGTTVPQIPAALTINPDNTYRNPVAEGVTSGLVAGLFA